MEKVVGPIFRDIRRYYCDFCGISRSKKSLLTSHLLSDHQEEMAQRGESVEDEEENRVKSTTCQECGISFKKPAHLRQHMQRILSYIFETMDVHRVMHWIPDKELQNARGCAFGLEWTSIRLGDLLRSSIKRASVTLVELERPYACSVDDCHASYRRKDHLNRHLLQHKGKLFKCPFEDCKSEFAFQANMKRHVSEFHSETSTSDKVDNLKEFACQEPGCGKVFRYHSKLLTHNRSHVKLDSVEAMCLEPGCLQQFSNEKCLRDHVQTCHQHSTCKICGSKLSKKSIARHLRSHEPDGGPSEKIKCDFEDCSCTFATQTNLKKHIKAVHLDSRPFACGFTGCGMRFSYKHVRDRHEKSGCHVLYSGNFEELDEQFRSRPRGGKKRECPTVDALVRKRVTAPSSDDECHSWFQSMENEESSYDHAI